MRAGRAVGQFSGTDGLILEYVSEEDYLRYAAAQDDLLAARRRDTFDLLVRNYSTLMDRFDFATHLLTLPSMAKDFDKRKLSTATMSSSVNFAASIGLYLDHQETYLKRRFGPESDEVQAFKAATAAAFDGSFGYKFFSGYRNYVLHCGLPYCIVSERRTDEDGREARFLLSRDDLLERHRWKASVRDALASQPAELEFVALVEEVAESLIEIEHRVLQVLWRNLVRHLPAIHDLISRVDTLNERSGRSKAPHDPYLVATIEPGSDASTFATPFVQILPQDVALIEAVRDAGDDEVDVSLSLPHRGWKHRDPLRSRFTIENRGLRLLLMYFSEGGRTSRVIDEANRILAQDQSIAPLFDQLIDAGALSLILAAHALGTEPEPLLASLLADVDHPSSSD